MAQLNIRAFWQYYKTTAIANLLFSAVFAAIKQEFIWLILIYCSFGTGIGILYFNYYHSKQYYFYHNLGYTRKKLAINTFLVNLPILVIALVILLIA